jgi:hypothetical protein
MQRTPCATGFAHASGRGSPGMKAVRTDSCQASPRANARRGDGIPRSAPLFFGTRGDMNRRRTSGAARVAGRRAPELVIAAAMAANRRSRRIATPLAAQQLLF